MKFLAAKASKALHRLDPETAHDMAIAALRSGVVPLRRRYVTSPRLETRFAGLRLPNPVGLAAGLDKNAVALGGLAKAGFGFLEVGAATPLPQPGNPKPRLFRLDEDRAAINRFGFNSDGMRKVAERLAKWRSSRSGKDAVVGLNLGANRDSADPAADFARVLAECGPHLDFATVNVSSPNTAGLRGLQAAERLERVLGRVMEARSLLANPIPVFVKIAPDMGDADLGDVVQVVRETGISGIVATNTTVAREGLTSRDRGESGGLSGKPLFDMSTRILARLWRLSEGSVPLIGVGGVASAQDAYEKIRAGAGAVQMYTAMVFDGLGLAARIAEGLDALLARDGHANVADAVGADAYAEKWR